MNTDSFDAIYCETWEATDSAGRGAIYWITDPDKNDVATLLMNVVKPDEGRGVKVTRHPEKKVEGVWLLTGPKEKPTLSPSLDCLEQNPRRSVWHGYLHNGRFESC